MAKPENYESLTFFERYDLWLALFKREGEERVRGDYLLELACKTAGVEVSDLSTEFDGYNEHASTIVEGAIGTLKSKPEVDAGDIEDLEIMRDVLKRIDEVRVVNSAGEMDYSRIDAQIVELCRAINEFPGIRTEDSCQGYLEGHREGAPWHVYFKPIERYITHEAYCSIEFLVYLINSYADPDFKASISVNSAPPYLNGPGRTLYFFIEGHNRHPDELAGIIRECREEWFFTHEEDADDEEGEM